MEKTLPAQSQNESQGITTTRRLINTYDQLKAAVQSGIISRKQAVAVSYSPRPSGRMGMAMCDKTTVWSPFFKTDPKAAWYDYDCKAFLGNRAESFEEAKAWASKEYGITNWKPNKTRDHVPAIVQKRFPIPREKKDQKPKEDIITIYE